MNCFSGSILLICLIACAACGVPASETTAGNTSTNYTVHYTITPDPRDGSVAIEMAVQQTRAQLRELSFVITGTRTSEIKADGKLQVSEDSVRWLPGRSGGSLHWRTQIKHQRGTGGYDGALFRNIHRSIVKSKFRTQPGDSTSRAAG